MKDETQRAEALRLQVTEAWQNLRMEGTVIVQASGFFITADALLLAYGFTQTKSSLFLLAAFMPLIMVFFYIYVRVQSIPTLYVAMVAEEELGLGDRALARNFGRIRLGYIFGVLDTDKINLSDENTLRDLLEHRVLKCLRGDSGSRAICGLVLLQLLLFLWTILGFHYRFK